jgi:phosphoserine phosphatase RsbU/P
LEGSEFIAKAFQLKTDDVVVMYTDGITEVENPERELWGRERLETLLRACRDCTPAQIVARILDEVLAFAKDRPQSDDMTLVVVGVTYLVCCFIRWIKPELCSATTASSSELPLMN